MKVNKNISQHLQKEFWKRRVHPDASMQRRINLCAGYYVNPIAFTDAGHYQLLTQEDLLREVEPSAHEINSDFQSTRPIYDARPKKDAEGKAMLDENGNVINEWYVSGFATLETSRCGWQKKIDLSKSAYMGGGGVWICHENKKHEIGTTLNSWKDTTGLNMAWQELVKSCFLTGDGAIYLYQVGNTLTYEVFSYLKGDVLFPDFDENHNPILYRLYTLRGKQAVDIYACGYIETWIQGGTKTDDDEETVKWWNRFSGWFGKGLDWSSTIESEDGWRRVSHRKTQISSDLCQAVYFRVDDCPHGVVQLEIEAYERAASFVAEGVKSASEPILFVKAADIDSLPAHDSHGKVIGVKGTIDELKASDAKYLGAPDISNIATIDLKNKRESIFSSTLTTEISADIFRSGADSSAAISLLFTDEMLWLKNEFVVFYPQLKYLFEVFKSLVAKLENNGEIATMRTSCGVDFYFPRNEAERLKMELDQVYARTKSRRAAMSDIGNSHSEDYEQIQKEWEDELRIKSFIPAEAKALVQTQTGTEISDISVADEPNPNIPNVDNNSKGKSILK